MKKLRFACDCGASSGKAKAAAAAAEGAEEEEKDQRIFGSEAGGKKHAVHEQNGLGWFVQTVTLVRPACMMPCIMWHLAVTHLLLLSTTSCTPWNQWLYINGLDAQRFMNVPRRRVTESRFPNRVIAGNQGQLDFTAG